MGKNVIFTTTFCSKNWTITRSFTAYDSLHRSLDQKFDLSSEVKRLN